VTQKTACGAWPSPISAERVVEASVRLGDIAISRDVAGREAVWWAEQRPSEGGRTQVVRRADDGTVTDVLPVGSSASTRVHEYGGGAWWLDGETLFYCEGEDQRIYRLDPGGRPWPVTPEPPTKFGLRYADGVVAGDWIICVQEDHSPDGEPANRLVAVPTGGGDVTVLFDASDFVAAPHHDAASGLMAFVTWDHPAMPWDSTQLWVAEFDAATGFPRLINTEPVAGGPGESIGQPRWDGLGRLWFVSDRTDWWNLYRFGNPGRPVGDPVPVAAGLCEVIEPMWVFGRPRYAFLSDHRVVFAQRSAGLDHLAVVDPATGRVDRVETPATEIPTLTASATTAVYVGASFTSEPAVHAVLVGRNGATGGAQLLRPGRDLALSSAHLSAGQHISFPTGASGTNGQVAHGIFYPPTNPEHDPLEGERPPLLVMIHGGPTSAAQPALRLGLQFWTSRGFAVVDVDYRGSTGYGRQYRDQLRGQWGVADVEDCVAAARFLADSGRVDPARVLIRGGSAGGFTTLAALTFTDVFAAGASYYGVADLALLAAETHKFEARYLDGLVGPYPEMAALYEERSPLAHIDQLDRPVIVFQGTEDKVVPPSQAVAIVSALARAGVPHAYLPIEGEGHGFRQAANIQRTLEAELSFYLQMLGIPHPDDLPRVDVVRPTEPSR
jgi:dipeptidyl aminopeptidase/acylaminoacyl peptidase